MLYDRPLTQILADEALPELPQEFTSSDVIRWVQAKYPKFRDSTIRAHLRSMSANDPNKHHYNSPLRDVFFKRGRSDYRRYDPDTDGIFDEMGQLITEGTSEGEEDSSDEEFESGVDAQEMGFALEKHLEEFMESNWGRIDFGRNLQPYFDEADRPARQFPTSIGVMDFLCEDTENGDLVVIELKKGRPSDNVLGQCQRYMGWVKQHLARPGQEVRGLIIAPEPDERLTYALSVAPKIELRYYKVDFELFSPPEDAPS